MERLWVFLFIMIAYPATNMVVRRLTGINPIDWRSFIYDVPAFLAGILTGFFILR